MFNMYRFKIRTKGGTHTIDKISINSTFSELKRTIYDLSGIDVDRQNLKVGYPPQSIKANDSDPLNLYFNNGDTINVDEITNLPKSAQQPPSQSQTITAVTIPSSVAEQSFMKANGATEFVRVEMGVIILREMPDDNSCLFRSIGYVTERNTTKPEHLRKVVAEVIHNDPTTYNEIILERTVDAYCNWIMKENSWGGAIELSIFSTYFQIEIDSIDVQTGRIDRFGEGKYQERVLILYSGIHYDALALSPTVDADKAFDQTIFNAADLSILTAAVELASILKKKHKYTDLANFTLQCGLCQKALRGESEAQEHAKITGHTSFEEYISV